MFEGDFADMCPAKNSAHVDGGLSGGPSMHRPGSKDEVEDPLRHERNSLVLLLLASVMDSIKLHTYQIN